MGRTYAQHKAEVIALEEMQKSYRAGSMEESRPYTEHVADVIAPSNLRRAESRAAAKYFSDSVKAVYGVTLKPIVNITGQGLKYLGKGTAKVLEGTGRLTCEGLKLGKSVVVEGTKLGANAVKETAKGGAKAVKFTAKGIGTYFDNTNRREEFEALNPASAYTPRPNPNYMNVPNPNFNGDYKHDIAEGLKYGMKGLGAVVLNPLKYAGNKAGNLHDRYATRRSNVGKFNKLEEIAESEIVKTGKFTTPQDVYAKLQKKQNKKNIKQRNKHLQRERTQLNGLLIIGERSLKAGHTPQKEADYNRLVDLYNQRLARLGELDASKYWDYWGVSP